MSRFRLVSQAVNLFHFAHAVLNFTPAYNTVDHCSAQCRTMKRCLQSSRKRRRGTRKIVKRIGMLLTFWLGSFFGSPCITCPTMLYPLIILKVIFSTRICDKLRWPVLHQTLRTLVLLDGWLFDWLIGYPLLLLFHSFLENSLRCSARFCLWKGAMLYHEKARLGGVWSLYFRESSIFWMHRV